MSKIISAQTAGNVLLILFGLLAAFHILILFNLLPSTIVWGGRAGSSSSPRALLTVSLIFNVLFAVVVAAKIGYIDISRLGRVIDIFLWIIFAYLLLNTAGNLASSSSLEKFLFTPITILAAFLVLRLVMGRQFQIPSLRRRDLLPSCPLGQSKTPLLAGESFFGFRYTRA